MKTFSFAAAAVVALAAMAVALPGAEVEAEAVEATNDLAKRDLRFTYWVGNYVSGLDLSKVDLVSRWGKLEKVRELLADSARQQFEGAKGHQTNPKSGKCCKQPTTSSAIPIWIESLTCRSPTVDGLGTKYNDKVNSVGPDKGLSCFLFR